MKEYIYKISFEPHILTGYDYALEDLLYFDIETTGFVPKSSILYLIGFIYFEDGEYILKQYFADSIDSEKQILQAFLSFAATKKALISFNGDGFDLPYISGKCRLAGIPCPLNDSESIDIYKCIKPYKKIFKLENTKQKSIEKFIGFERTDLFAGKELIEKYFQYLKVPSDGLLRALLCHNREDVTGLLNIDSILNYSCINTSMLRFESMIFKNAEKTSANSHSQVYITLKLPLELPAMVSYGNDEVFMQAHGTLCKLTINVYEDELKYFYPDYKDYYYLPEEDRSIHKSVAFYVDKNFRTKAKAANCYSKKTGTFLPQYDEIVSPYFKIDYHDKITYFEYTAEFTSNDRLILDYAMHLINHLLK